VRNVLFRAVASLATFGKIFGKLWFQKRCNNLFIYLLKALQHKCWRSVRYQVLQPIIMKDSFCRCYQCIIDFMLFEPTHVCRDQNLQKKICKLFVMHVQYVIYVSYAAQHTDIALHEPCPLTVHCTHILLSTNICRAMPLHIQ